MQNTNIPGSVGLLGMKRMEMALMFINMEDFSTMCSEMEPGELVALLEQYYNVV